MADVEKIKALLDRGEVGDAMLLAELFTGKLLYDTQEKQWYFFGGNVWEQDTNGHTRRIIAHELPKAYLTLVNSDKDLNSKVYSRCAELSNKTRINSVLDLARDYLYKPSFFQWDHDPYLLAVSNGVVDLRTGELRPGTPSDFIRTQLDVEYHGLAEKAPKWEKFLQEIFNNDHEVINFMQRLLGYSLTAQQVEHVLPVLYGAEGRNGKNILLSAIQNVLGESNACQFAKELLLSGNNNPGASMPFMAELANKRIVWIEETSENAHLSEAQIKMLTGGAKFQARELYSKPVQVTPKYTCLVLTNFRPVVSSNDAALWERVLLVEFTQRFIDNPQFDHEHKADKFLLSKLEQEKSGILAWLVSGCLSWNNNGLQVPESIKYSTVAYRDSMDFIHKFIESECSLGVDCKMPIDTGFKRFSEWMKQMGNAEIPQREFKDRLCKISGIGYKRYNSGYAFTGIKLAPTAEDFISDIAEAELEKQYKN